MKPITFLHSSDWQLGMVRRFLGPDGQARFAQARLDAVARIGEVATTTGAEFVVVAGDVFEHNQVERQTILRAAEALKRIDVPVLLVPGNHDALEPGSLWTSPQWRAHAPEHVTVLTDGTPYDVLPGVQVIAAPWRSRRPLTDPVAPAYEGLETADGQLRIIVGHGQFDELNGGLTDVPAIDVNGLERAIEDGRVHYVALGDRHSATKVRDRIWYSGSQEVTSTEETDAGNVLAVTLGDHDCDVASYQIGTWHMIEHRTEVDGEDSITALENWFAELPDKERTYIRLGVSGTLSLPLLSRLDAIVDAQGEVFASVERSRKQWTVRPMPQDADFEDLALSGPARAALHELRQALAGGDDEAAAALALMHRLATTAPRSSGSRSAG
ncbi:MAG TPA: DNA repair exonuclease [Kribbellaceae bacterium]|nr:DNA repair exonuclease [Kribbellaceae bacterium]